LYFKYKQLPEDIRKEFFNYCADTYKSGLFKGWDWHQTMVELAINLATNKEEVGLAEALDHLSPN